MTPRPALNPEIDPVIRRVIEAVLAPVVLEHDEHDPWACQTCDIRPAELTITFPDGRPFEVCSECRTLAGAMVTAGPLLNGDLVLA